MNIKVEEKRKDENNREFAYRILRKNIMSLQILPGESLNEGELSDLFHMSRTPVHEAVMMLKEESLVRVIPQSGSRVTHIDINILKEGYFLRSVVEPEIIRQLAGTISQENAMLLKNNLEQQEKILQQEDNIDDFFKLDDKFHKIIYKAAEKKLVWDAVKRVSSHYDRVRYLDAIRGGTNLREIYGEHKKIYQLLFIGYASDFNLNDFYERHLGTYKKHFSRILEESPEYFDLF